MPITVTVRRNDIRRCQASIAARSVDAVRDTAHDMRGYARTIAPVLTGAFRESLYVNGPEGESDYAAAAGAALSRRPRARIVPELRAATILPPMNQLRNNFGQFSLPEALVAPAVDYGLDLEQGTAFMAPRPTLHRSAIVYEPRLRAAMSQVADGF